MVVIGMHIWWSLIRCKPPTENRWQTLFLQSTNDNKRQTYPARKTDVAKPVLTASLIKFAD